MNWTPTHEYPTPKNNPWGSFRPVSPKLGSSYSGGSLQGTPQPKNRTNMRKWGDYNNTEDPIVRVPNMPQLIQEPTTGTGKWGDYNKSNPAGALTEGNGWWGDSNLNPSNWSQEGLGMVNTALQGVSGLWDAYNGHKQMGLAKDQFNYSKKFSNANFKNTADSLNNVIAQKNRYLGFSGYTPLRNSF